MVQLKNGPALAAMREAGKITGEALLIAGEHVAPGVTTKQLDDIVRREIEKHGAKPSFLGYGGFPASACISVNEEVIHGIPSATRVLQEGDIVSIDVGAYYKGFHGDSANTFACGKISEEAKALIEGTKESFYEGIKFAEAGYRLGDIGAAVEACAVKHGYSVVRDFVGHGVGRDLHEDPNVPNYGTPGRGLRLVNGMVIAIEPMICAGKARVKILPNKWTVVTEDGSLAAHYEHTCALTPSGLQLLTKVD